MSDPIYSEEELNEMHQGINIVRYLMLSIFVFLFVLNLFYDESEGYKQGQKFAYHRQSYSGIVVKKHHSGGRHPRYLILKTGMELNVDEDIFFQVSVGDSVYKKAYFDTVYYFTLKHGKIARSI